MTFEPTIISSRSGLKNAERKVHKACLDYVIISVRGLCERKPYLVPRTHRPHRKGMLFLVFDDISESEDGYLMMTDVHAKSIVDFVSQNSDKIFICQCEAGQSRSLGIAAAIRASLHGDLSLSNEFPSDASRYVYDMIIANY